MIKTSAKQWLEIIGFADIVKGSYKVPYTKILPSEEIIENEK